MMVISVFSVQMEILLVLRGALAISVVIVLRFSGFVCYQDYQSY
jgi:hypothetical protein